MRGILPPLAAVRLFSIWGGMGLDNGAYGQSSRRQAPAHYTVEYRVGRAGCYATDRRQSSTLHAGYLPGVLCDTPPYGDQRNQPIGCASRTISDAFGVFHRPISVVYL
jgi:hypothetical protein